MSVKPRNPKRNQAGTTREPVEGKAVPPTGFPVGEPSGTSPSRNHYPATIKADHDPSPWLTQEMAEEIAESMPTGYDSRGTALIPPRRLTVEQYRAWLEGEVERWGGYVWWIA